MYFDFEDYRPDISPVGGAISLREGVLLAFIAHLVGVIFLLLSPKLFPEDAAARRARVIATQQGRQRADRWVTRCGICSGTCRTSRSTTRAVPGSSVRKFSSTPKASSSGHGSADSSPR